VIRVTSQVSHGTARARLTVTMAAVFALVFLFALTSTMLFVKTLGALTFGTAIAGVFFVALAGGVFVGLFRLAKQWEHEAD
jgi:hypothetical protein